MARHGLDMLLSQYRGATSLRAYIQCFLDEFAEVKKANEDVIKYRYLADSFGMMVDDIAYLVGASRTIYGAAALGYFGFYSEPGAYPAGDDNNPDLGGVLKSDNDKDSGDFVMNDSQLKDSVRARIIKITGNCSIEQLLAYIDLVVGRNLPLQITEGHKRMDYVVHGTLSVAERVLMAYMLPEFKPTGIHVTLRDNNGDIALVYVSNVYPRENV